MIYKTIKQILFRELRIICPTCTQPMLVEVRLTAEANRKLVSCITCSRKFAPLIPGSIISSPSKA